VARKQVASRFSLTIRRRFPNRPHSPRDWLGGRSLGRIHASITLWPLGVSPIWVAAVVALLFLPPYWVMTQFGSYPTRSPGEIDVDVFLVRMVSLVVPYVAWALFRGIARAQQELRALRPVLGLSEHELESLVRSLASCTWRRFAALLGVAALLALFFQQRNSGRVTQILESPSVADFWLLVCGTTAWTVTLIFAWFALRNANALRRLASDVKRLDPFDIDPIRPFGRFGLRMALYTMGGIAIFQACGVLVAPSEIKGPRILIASTAVVSAAIIFLLPTWGIHQQQRRRKVDLLRQVQGEIAARPDSREAPLHPLLDLLEYRDQIRRISEWPFETPEVLRLALYMVLPLASWVASALVQRLLDRLL
jgi:hypothetical protein